MTSMTSMIGMIGMTGMIVEGRTGPAGTINATGMVTGTRATGMDIPVIVVGRW